MPKSRYPEDYEPVTPAHQLGSWGSKTEAASVWPAPGPNKPNDKGKLDEPGNVNIPLATAAAPQHTDPWSAKRGHLFSYLGLFFFTVVLYFRPYELFSALSSFTSLAYWIAIATIVVFVPSQLALEGNLTARPREVNLILLLVLLALLSMPLALQPAEAWETFNKEFIKAVLMFIVMVNVVRTEPRLKGLLVLSLAVSCVLSVSALIDYRIGNLALQGQRISGLIGGMFGNPNDMALYLVTTTPIAAALMFSTRNPLLKIGYAVCVLLTIGGNVVTFSRGGFLGLMGVVAVFAWKIGRRNRLLMMLLIFGATLGFMLLAPGEYTSRIGSIVGHGGDLAGAASAESRQALLIRSIQISLRHPLLGVGMGNFHIVSIHELVSHNAYTQVSAELGLCALAVYLMFMLSPLKRLREIERENFQMRRQARIYYLAVGLQASIVGYMISSFFASVAYQWYIYYLVGYAVVLRRLYAVQRAKQTNNTTQAVPFDAPTEAVGADPFALPKLGVGGAYE
jgi:MFS family permease